MRTPEAESLVGPGRLTRLAHDPGGDLRALARLATDGERFSPTVALEDAEFPEALLLDATGLAPLWGATREEGEERMAHAVQGWLRGERLRAAVVVASTTSLALAATRHADWLGLDAFASPLVLTRDERVIDRLPIEALLLEGETTDKLRGLGVETVGLLRELPRSSLPARFGPALVRRLDQLTGDAPEPLVAVREAPPLVASWPYETPVSHGEALLHTVGRLLERLATEMRRRRRGALRVLVTYEPDAPDEAAKRIALRLFRPTAFAKELKELAELHSSGVRFQAPVRSVHVLVGATAPLHNQQRTLFESDACENPHELALLINRLATRLGFERVSRVERRRSVDPQRAFAFVPATDNLAKRFDLTGLQAERMRRLPLAMVAAVGESVRVATDSDGTPTSVFLPVPRLVIRCCGPERVETGWWRGRGFRRDAYWVELEDGARLWLCRDLRSRAWRLAGEFC